LCFDDRSGNTFYNIKIGKKFVRFSRYLYEQYNNEVLSSSDIVFHKDGNSMNLLKENLIKINRIELMRNNIDKDDAFLKRILRISDPEIIERIKSEFPDLINIKKSAFKLNKEIKKHETAESTGSGSAGSFEGPLFSKMETNEKWTEKYKKSINCNNPKGFSQKAHCQGRKKKLREDELMPDEQVNNFENEYSVERVRFGKNNVTFVGLDKDYNPDKTKDVILRDNTRKYTLNPTQISLSFFDKKNLYVPNSSNIEDKDKKSKPIFNSKSFKEALKTIFPENWKEQTEDDITPGLRGIYELGSGDTWSILNYFDTNSNRMSDINTLFLNSTETDPVLWLEKFLTDGNNANLKKMLELQKEAVNRSDKIERDAMEIITNNAYFFPKGHKSDRYDAIDSIDLNTGLSYQIKATKDIEEYVDDETGEMTYRVIGSKSRFSDYKNKTKLKKIVYYIPKIKTCYIFDNEDYKVISNDEVIHYGPLEIKSKES
jgi:hypothetical protein